jgi:hypothetical protein
MTAADAQDPIDRPGAGATQDPPPLDAAAAISAVEAILDLVTGMLPRPRPKVERVVDYPDVVRYFVDAHPHRPAVRGGVVIRTPVPRGWLITQIFLETRAGPPPAGGSGAADAGWLTTTGNLRVRFARGEDGGPLGRHVVTRRVGAELAERFGDGDVLFIT